MDTLKKCLKRPREKEPLRKSKRLRRGKQVEDWSKWVSASSTRNYLLKDPLCDWLNVHYKTPVQNLNKSGSFIVNTCSPLSRNESNFTEFILEQGKLFESNILRLMYQKFGDDNIVDIGGELNARSSEKVEETISAMKKGIPFIHSGVFHNHENETYGVPDLLVRSDWINDLVCEEVLKHEEIHIPAYDLIDKLGNCPTYHYLVIDIKFSTLYLRSDSTHILNCGSFPAYKAQLLVYNQALANVQGYNPHKAYILGRRWRSSSKGENFFNENCFDRLGVIDYSTVDYKYISKTKKAISWIRLVRTEDASKWNLTSTPLSRKELYPNMCNTHDYPWSNVKKEMAKKVKEITSVWMVSVKNRKIAHKKGIYSWNNRYCTLNNLGINKGKNSRIIEKILNTNRSKGKYSKGILFPKVIKNNSKGWNIPEVIEFYVDFETVNDVLSDNSKLPNIESLNMIFMIGVGYVEPLTKVWVYKHFTVDSLTLAEESRICKEFTEYIHNKKREYHLMNKRPLCIHWAPAEKSFWEKALLRHPNDNINWKLGEWLWFDLLQVFKDEPITIKGCLNYKLKEVATVMREHNLIKTSWNNTSCSDGQNAMIRVLNAQKEANIRKCKLKNLPQIQEIVKYNEDDVKVLYEIISYLRDKHTK